MKPSLRYKLEFCLFLCIIIFSLFSFRFLIRSLEKKIVSIRDGVLSELEDTYRIRFTYESLSPSIFRSISLRNVTIYDAVHNSELASFEDFSIQYRFLALLGGNSREVVRGVVIKNGFFRFDTAAHTELLDALKKVIPSSKKVKKKPKIITLSRISSSLQPLDVHIKNIQFSVRDDVQSAFINIFEGLCVIDSTDVTLSLKSHAVYRHKVYTGAHSVETDFTIEGGIERDTVSGYGTAYFSRINAFGCGVNAMQFFLSYENDVFSIGTMKNILSLDFNAGWNIKTNEAFAHFSCRDFAPGEKIAFYNAPKNFRQFLPLKVTGTADVLYKKDVLTWKSDVSCAVPPFAVEGFAAESSTVHIAAQGKNKDLSIDTLSVQGKGIDIESALQFSLDTMVPSGFLHINMLQLPSGSVVSAALAFKQYHNRLYCTIPSVKFGDSELLSVQVMLHPVDEKVDYTLSAKDKYGNYSFDGSYLFRSGEKDASNFLELHGALDSVSIGTLFGIVQSVAPNLAVPTRITEPLQCTTEFYLFSDLERISYNCVRFVLVSKEIDDFYALVSLKGGAHSFDITDIDISYKKIHIRGDVGVDVAALNDMIFHTNLVVNNIGYSIQGAFSENVLSLYGDYGIAVSALYDPATGLKGSFRTDAMPLPLLPLFFSCDSEFSYLSIHDWNVELYEAHLTFAVSKMKSATTGMNFYGAVNPSGVFLYNVRLGSSYDDMLTGSVTLLAQSAKKEYAGFVHLVSVDSGEKMELETFLSLENGVYLNGNINLERVALRRFFPNQGRNHIISAQGAFSGGKDTFTLSLALSNLFALVKGKNLQLSSVLKMENGTVECSETSLSWGSHQASGITGSFAVFDGVGSVCADYTGSFSVPQTDGSFVTNPLKAHVTASFESAVAKAKKGSGQAGVVSFSELVSAFSVNALVSDWQLSHITGSDAFPVTIIRDKEVTAFYAGKNDELLGFKTDDGFLSLQLAKSLPLSCNANGTVTTDVLDMNITNISINMKTVWDITNMDYVKFFDGTVSGDLVLGGKLSEPDFKGKLYGKDILVHSPHYIPEVFRADLLEIVADGTMLEVPYTVLEGPSTNIWAHCTADFFQWIPKEIVIECGTLNNKKGVLDTDNLLFRAKGYAGCNAEIIITPDAVTINGAASFDSGYLALKLYEMDKFNARYAKTRDITFSMNLDLTLGKKAEFRWPTADFPILRSFVPTETPLLLTADSRNEKFSVKGRVKMRGGEVFYIKRNFYIREGSLLFLERGRDIEPLVSLRAEIRDRDEKGKPMTLILTAKEQPLMTLKPLLTSDPPRSSQEIMQLLGGILTGNTSKENFLQDVLITGTDLLAQVGFFKKSEVKIRNFLHLDAFSFRTLLLQNAIFGNLFNAKNNTALNASNYLDNTSVYIGKYFGSAIYVDGLLKLSNYDPKLVKNSVSKRLMYKNILFQPEIGVEMSTPFFMLRWACAPEQLDTMFVGDTSLTFSWKYSY